MEVSWIIVLVLYLLHEFVKHWLVGLAVLASWALAHLGLTAASFYAGINSDRDWIIILTVVAFLFAYVCCWDWGDHVMFVLVLVCASVCSRDPTG
jgi:hypothetical protein